MTPERRYLITDEEFEKIRMGELSREDLIKSKKKVLLWIEEE